MATLNKKRTPTRRRKVTREPWHGTVNGYQWHGCRCTACKHAMARYQAEYRKRKLAGRRCAVKGCPRVASQAAGNGLCYKHHAKKMASK